jgi:hypothetical protein
MPVISYYEQRCSFCVVCRFALLLQYWIPNAILEMTVLQIRNELTKFFSTCGEVQNVRIPTDKETGNQGVRF